MLNAYNSINARGIVPVRKSARKTHRWDNAALLCAARGEVRIYTESWKHQSPLVMAFYRDVTYRSLWGSRPCPRIETCSGVRQAARAAAREPSVGL